MPAVDESSPGKKSDRSAPKTKAKRGRGASKRTKKKSEVIEETPIVEAQPDEAEDE